jgi:hypothetical protein
VNQYRQLSYFPLNNIYKKRRKKMVLDDGKVRWYLNRRNQVEKVLMLRQTKMKRVLRYT